MSTDPNSSLIGPYCYVLFQRMVRNMRNLTGQAGCQAGDLNTAASSMEDLAGLIEEVGIDALQKELGIDMSFVLNDL